MRKYLIIIPLLLSACGSTPDVLSCEEAMDSMASLTRETQRKFGGEDVIEFIDKNRSACENEKVENISECGADSFCVRAFGTRAASISACESNEGCEIAYASAHISDCDEYTDRRTIDEYDDGYTGSFDLKEICLFARAHVSQSTASCDGLKYDSLDQAECTSDQYKCYFNKNKCIWTVSDITNDADLCEEMTDSTEKDICYYSAALREGNASHCSKISKVSDCDKFVKNPDLIPKEGIFDVGY